MTFNIIDHVRSNIRFHNECINKMEKIHPTGEDKKLTPEESIMWQSQRDSRNINFEEIHCIVNVVHMDIDEVGHILETTFTVGNTIPKYTVDAIDVSMDLILHKKD